MKSRLENISQIKLIGKRVKMSFVTNKTMELWKEFMPRKKQINSLNEDLYSVEIYNDKTFFQNFNPQAEFYKWAAVAVDNFDSVPEEMETLIIPAGLYAVFIYKGKQTEAENAYRYIFSNWLPSSIYELDNRPHFALMGEKYKNNDTNSEEELWIPIKENASR